MKPWPPIAVALVILGLARPGDAPAAVDGPPVIVEPPPEPPLPPPWPGRVERARYQVAPLDAGSSGPGGPSQAGAATDAPTIAQAAQVKPDETNRLARALNLVDAPVKVYGWVQASFTGNTDGTPKNRSNFGVFPNRLANQFQLNQTYLALEKPLRQDDSVNFGYRFDTLFGNDWQFTKSYGLFDRAFHNNQLAGVDLPQMFAEVHLPVLTKNGLDIKGGRFYSPAGFENVQPIKRPLLSVPYLFNFTPFTLFGMMATLHLSERVNLYGGTYNGWDRWIDRRYHYSYIGGLNATTRDGRTNLVSFVLVGPDQLPSFAPANSPFLPTGVVTSPFLQGRRNPEYPSSVRTYNSNVLTHTWSDKFSEALEVFFVHEPNVPGLGKGGGVARESAWYGASHWYLYQMTPKVQGVYRAEIFRDQNGGATGVADTYYEMTVGAVYKPKPWYWIRPEVRYDWAQFKKPFEDGTRGSQLTLAIDVIIQF